MSSASTSTPASKSKSTPAKIAARRKLKADQNGTLLAGAIMAGVGWVLLVRLVGGSPPLAFPRWLFFILIYMAITGTVLPLIWFLNRRFSRRHPATGGIILRQSMWFGLFAVTATWMQMTRALSGAVAFFLALSMIVIETFLRLRERSQDGS
jgi:hypothetical protein